MSRPRGSQRVLVAGLALIVVIFFVEAAADAYLTGDAEERAWQLERNSVLSIEYLNRIARDLDEERILVDDHILESDATRMAEIERRRSQLIADLARAEQKYAPFVELPNEAGTWSLTQSLINRFHEGVGATLALSRQNLNVEAQAKLDEVRSQFQELDRHLYELIQINRVGALEAVTKAQALDRSTDRIALFARLAGLVTVGILGFWLMRRVRAYENEIDDYSQTLENRNRDLDAFAGRVAHDVKNALGPLVMAPSRLRRTATDPTKVSEVADRIERSSLRANSIVDALLAFSRAARNGESGEAGALRPALASVVEEVAPLVAQFDAAIELEEVPDLLVRCDPGLLHIVLANLVGNAVKYLEGQDERRVRISAHKEDAACRIEVQDTGPGIPEGVRDKIFEPFYRVDGTQAAGTGIGLATVRRVLDACGGRVAVESVEGRGSRFQVWLPLAE